MNQREIYLAGGCFWGTEAYLKRIPGVLETEVGYAIQMELPWGQQLVLEELALNYLWQVIFILMLEK